MPDEMASRDTKVAIVGAGYHSASFLASNSLLLEGDLTVVERSSNVASTAFREFDATTTSVGSKFFQHVDYGRQLRHLKHDADFLKVAEAKHPVHMRELTRALDALGSALQVALGGRLLAGTEVRSLDVYPGEVVVKSSEGIVVRAKHVVLATGRREVLLDELKPHESKVEMSGDFIRHSNDLTSRLRHGDFARGPIVILGSSHSALSVIKRLLATHELAREVDVVLLQRSPARLMYPHLQAAIEQQVHGRERRAVGDDDVCPVTGVVFRDSGLRNVSRDLYCLIWEGRVPGVELIQAPSSSSRYSLFESASVIVQAVGYQPNHPSISVGGDLRLDASAGRLEAAEDASALIDGLRVPEVSLLRLGQTPKSLRDHANFGEHIYRDLRRKLGVL